MGTLPFAISLPHCASEVPEEIKPCLAVTSDEIRESVDIGSGEIFGDLPVRAVVRACWSRLVVDLNRGPGQAGSRGVIPRMDYHGRPVYLEGSFPDADEVLSRLERYYWPFHHRIMELVTPPSVRGLFDCHSLYGIGPSQAPDHGQRRKDITLGNNGKPGGRIQSGLVGTTCPPETLQLMKTAFEACGFSVAVNNPYSGGFITSHYGLKFSRSGKFVVQIEINQDLFVGENDLEPIPEKVAEVRSRVLDALQRIADGL